jgi:hypothetical protein
LTVVNHFIFQHFLFYKLNCVTHIDRRMRWAGHVALMVEMRNAHKILVIKRRCKWEGHFRMDLREIGWEGVDLGSPGSV